MLPGVQVLFAFLLTVPFSTRFNELSSESRTVYFVCFAATTLSSVMLIAPSSQHRLRWRVGDKEMLLQRANRLAIAGTAFLTIAIAAAVYLVTEFVYSNAAAGVGTALLVGTTVWFWYVQPLTRKSRGVSG